MYNQTLVKPLLHHLMSTSTTSTTRLNSTFTTCFSKTVRFPSFLTFFPFLLYALYAATFNRTLPSTVCTFTEPSLVVFCTAFVNDTSSLTLIY